VGFDIMKLSLRRSLLIAHGVLISLGTFAAAQDVPKDRPADRKPEDRGELKRKDAAPERQRDPEMERFARMKREIQELQQAGKPEEAERLRRELMAAVEGRQNRERREGREDRGKAREGAEGPARLRHVQEAIRHLRAAGMMEPAQHLEEAARQMRQELERQNAGRGNEPQPQKGARPDAGPSEELRREIGQLREQLQRMSQEVREMRAQMEKKREGDRQ
jgi:hypothetical protein